MITDQAQGRWVDPEERRRAAVDVLRQEFAESESLAVLAPRLANLDAWIAREAPPDPAVELEHLAVQRSHAERSTRPRVFTRSGRDDRRRMAGLDARKAELETTGRPAPGRLARRAWSREWCSTMARTQLMVSQRCPAESPSASEAFSVRPQARPEPSRRPTLTRSRPAVPCWRPSREQALHVTCSPWPLPMRNQTSTTGYGSTVDGFAPWDFVPSRSGYPTCGHRSSPARRIDRLKQSRRADMPRTIRPS